ncbi:MAG: YIP1 family protein [Candidatus Methanofastidiosia archaeon]
MIILRVLNPFTAGKAFQELKPEKKWILAFSIVLLPALLTSVGNGLIQQKQQDLTYQYIKEQGTITEDQLEAVESIQGLMAGIGIVFGIVLAMVFWVLKSAIFHVIAKIFGGGKTKTEGEEKTNISSIIYLIAYTYVPFVFKGILDVYKGLVYQAPSYEIFVQQLQTSDALLTFVREHNIFLVWALILMAVAVKEQYNLSKFKATLVVLIPYGVAWILQLGLASMSSQLMGGI